jgi:hypothetical protein
MAYNRLLNYLMMRALDAEPDTRLSAHELYRYLSVLQPLVRHLFELGQGVVFKDKDGTSCEIADSCFFRWIFVGFAYSVFLDGENRTKAVPFVMEPVRIMDDDDHRSCLELAEEMGIHDVPEL